MVRSIGYGAYGEFDKVNGFNNRNGRAFHGLGAFGKGAIVPPPGVAPPDASPDIVFAEEEVTTTETSAPPAKVVHQVVPAAAPSVDPQVAYLRAAIARAKAAKAAKDAERKAYQEKLQKQAAYGRDTVQAKPKEAGYTTEAEKLMGGQTGYSGLGSFGQVSTRDIELATEAVKQINKDVKAGVATKADLEAAIADLKAKIASKGASGLGGFGFASNTRNLVLLGAVGIAVYMLVIRK